MNDSLVIAYTLLVSMKQQVQGLQNIEERHGKAYNAYLKSIEETTGSDLSAYAVPLSAFKPIVVSGSFGTLDEPARVNYSQERYMDRTDFLMRLDAVMLLFQIRQENTKIGFNLE